MTSKNLYFKLMKEDLKNRLWAVALIGLGFFFMYPVWVAFAAGEIKDYEVYEQGFSWFSKQLVQWLSFENGLMVFVMVVTALICGLSGFAYLNSRSKVDFYHSIPVKREKLFLVNYLNGILMLAVPYAVSLVMAVLVGISNGVDGGKLWQVAIAAYGLHMTYFILMYATVVIAVMMTGNLVIAFLGTLVFSFLVPLCAALTQGYFGTFFHTYVWESGSKLMERASRLSPFIEYIYQIDQYMDGKTVWSGAVAALAVAAVLAVIGCVLYRKRPSEAAGKAMAFAVSKPVIRILLTLVSALGLGVFVWGMRESTGWAVFGVVCGAVLSHCVIEIIYHFDFKKLFANRMQLVVCTVVSLAVLFVFRYDLAGYDKYLPAAGDVKSSAVQFDRLNSWTSYGNTVHLSDGTYEWGDKSSLSYIVEHMNCTDIENLLEIAASGIEETKEQGPARLHYPSNALASGGIDPETPENYTVATICYTLKSGRKVYRSYVLDIDKVMPQIDKLYGSEAFQKGTYPVMTKEPENVAQIYYSESRKETRINGLTAEEKAIILETYQREFAAMTLAQMKEEFPVGLIRFTSETDEAGMQWWSREAASGFEEHPQYRYREDLSDRDFYPVYPSCKETIRLLREHQIDPGADLRNMNIQSVTVRWYRDTESYDDPGYAETVITDPAEIAQLKGTLLMGRNYYNQMFRVSELDIEISAEKDGVARSYGGFFPHGRTPEFIKERLMAPGEK